MEVLKVCNCCKSSESQDKWKRAIFDYAACAYPEGMVGDRLMYFQHSDVSKVVFEGFSDDDEKMMCANIQKAMEMLEIERADVRQLKQNMGN